MERKKTVFDFVSGARARLIRFEAWYLAKNKSEREKPGKMTENQWWDAFDDFDLEAEQKKAGS